MAGNATAVQNGANFPDWVELYNRTSNSVSLANWSLSNSGNTRKFVFPANATLAAGGYLVVWCDASTNDPGLHTGFGLAKSGENVFLYDANTNRVDAVSFGQQITDLSLGRVNGQWQLTLPTPNAPNVAATLGASTNVSINEWLANPAPGQFGSVRPDGNGRIDFTFNSLPGQSYQLQYKNDLSRPQWTPLGPPVAGIGGTLTLSDAMAAQPQRFYRIVVTEE